MFYINMLVHLKFEVEVTLKLLAVTVDCVLSKRRMPYTYAPDERFHLGLCLRRQQRHLWMAHIDFAKISVDSRTGTVGS